ncbi:hypothetical protein AVEN_195180-1 [Araneus ventricosus]|uniref:Uncharacterized protein n=1 Tax=Araneus ventricosus TaxID=182803 RepID=A0A4Y2Q923_ARAVE|nr:hypothetical protein AVEN_66466-1 [Araneus ventricosus]GBN59964.1 hypothetical protein AVEN_195180-1 [Araneus ventricosus]
MNSALCCLKTVQHKSCGEGVVFRGSRSLNLAAVAWSLATSLLKPIGGTTLRALNPGVLVNLATENEGQRVLGERRSEVGFRLLCTVAALGVLFLVEESGTTGYICDSH